MDQRLHAYRPDLADIALKDKVKASQFIKPLKGYIGQSVSALRAAPMPSAMQLTQALPGEQIMVFEKKQGWAWVQLACDGYVGYVEEKALTTEIRDTTHQVIVPLTYRYPEASIKSQPAHPLPLHSKLAGQQIRGEFLAVASGYIYAPHVAPMRQKEHDKILNPSASNDFVITAEAYCHVPYLWGGKTFLGIDCSGLVQIALQNMGLKAPRDSDLQEQALGQLLAPAETRALQRGDLIFWRGHVGIMQDDLRIIHASGYHMQVVSEALAAVIARNEAKGMAVTSVKRLWKE